MNEAQTNAYEWARECIKGHRRGKGELLILEHLVDLIDEQVVTIDLLNGRKDDDPVSKV